MTNTAQQVLNNLRIQSTYTLQYPIHQPDGKVISELQVRRIKGKDLRDFENAGFDAEKDAIKMTNFYILRLTGILPEDLDEMDSTDVNNLSQIIMDLVTEGKSGDSTN